MDNLSDNDRNQMYDELIAQGDMMTAFQKACIDLGTLAKALSLSQLTDKERAHWTKALGELEWANIYAGMAAVSVYHRAGALYPETKGN